MNAPASIPALLPRIRYLSVCSGIEAATVAWEPLGWVPVAFAEVDASPSRVLARRWPHVQNLGDFTAIDIGALGPLDLLVGGTPCQDFSVAGRGASLGGARGNLTLAFADLAHALALRSGLRWAVWENVPGVLSRRDNAFGHILARFVGGDDALHLPRGVERWPDTGMVAGPRARAAWRVLDAQYFGLAQRRRRVFLVVGFGDGVDPAAVLFERAGLRRHPPSRGEAGQGVAASLTSSLGRRGGQPDGGDTRGHLIAATLDASFGRLQGCSNQDLKHGCSHLVAYGGNDTRGAIEVATALNAHDGPHGRQDFESETFVVASTLRAREGARGVDSDGTDTLIAHSLRAEGFDASEDGTGRGTPLVPVCFDTTQITSRENRCAPQPGDSCHPLAVGAPPPAIAFTCKDHGQDASAISPTLRAMAGGHANAGGQAAVAFQGRGTNIDLGQDVTGTLGSGADRASSGAPCVATAWAVRRLTPRECHRLQGFPDDHAAIPGAADGPIYKALGNSMAVPCMAWIGRRIDAYEHGACGWT